MAFGFWMEIVEGDVRLRLGPVRRDEVARYVAEEPGFGLQSLPAITSEAAANVASNRALAGVGYVRSGVHCSATHARSRSGRGNGPRPRSGSSR